MIYLDNVHHKDRTEVVEAMLLYFTEFMEMLQLFMILRQCAAAIAKARYSRSQDVDRSQKEEIYLLQVVRV